MIFYKTIWFKKYNSYIFNLIPAIEITISKNFKSISFQFLFFSFLIGIIKDDNYLKELNKKIYNIE